MTQAALAEACGWDGQSRVSNYETGEREPDLDDLATIARVTGVNGSWLATGEGEMTGPRIDSNASGMSRIQTWRNGDELDRHIIIPRYDVWASMGHGNHISDEPVELQGDAYRESFARDAGWSSKTHFSMRVKGDSMIEAGLRDGWSVVIDSRDTIPEPGEAYAIKYGRDFMVKFLEPLPNGGLRIVSANRAHPAFRDPVELSPELADHVNVLGRVVHVQGLFGRKR